MRPGSVLGLLSVLTAVGQERPWTEVYPEEAAAANKACAAKAFAECRGHLLRLKEMLDGRGDVILRLAKVEESLGHAEAAREWFAIYSRMGLQLGDAAHDAPPTAISVSQVFVTLGEKDLIPEDITYDSVGGRFYISSVRHRKILSVTKEGTVSDFLPEGDAPVFALAADPVRRVLWATTVDEGKSALLRLSLESGKLLKRYDLPAGAKHELGDMTLSASGDAYVSDGLGSVYLVDHKRDGLELLFGPGTFRSPQTPALSPDGRRLFVPDYSRGIGIVDLATKECKLLEHPADLSLAGIDGMYLKGRTMVAIQNGTTPERLIRMQLDTGLTKVTGWETIEANWKGLGDPTHGVVVGDQFYFIANSGWDVKPGGVFEAASIRVMRM